MSLPVVTGDQTTTLAWFAEMAYEDSWSSEVALGWHLVSGSELGISSSLLSDGHYANANGAAMVASANFNGSDVLMIAFRGSDDNADWVTNLSDIDEHFELFNSLTTAAQAALDAGTYDAIMVTGHSLGGAMTEVYLHSYSDPNIYGISWGSPGIHMDDPVADSRLVNYVFTDDGVAWLGTQRAEIADEIGLFSLGGVAEVIDALGIAASIGLVAALADISGDYEHQGTTAIISADGDYLGYYDSGLALNDGFSSYVATHDMGRYLLTSLDLNANPFTLPDSTVSGTMLSDAEALVVQMYDTTFNALPDTATFTSYATALDSGSSALELAASMLSGTGLRRPGRDDFLDTLYNNVLGRDATADEKSTIYALYNDAGPANVLLYLASSEAEDWAMSSMVSLLGVLDVYG